MNFHPEALLHLCDEPAHLEKPPHVRLHLRLRTSVRFEFKANETWIQVLCVTTVWGWHKLWQAGKDFVNFDTQHMWHLSFCSHQHHFHWTFFSSKLYTKNTPKEDFLHQKTSKTHSFLTLWLQLKKITPAPHMLHVTNIGYGPQSTFINVATKWFMAVLLQNAHFCWRWYLETFASLRCSICIEIVNMTFQAFLTHQSLFLSTSCQRSQL